MRILGLVLLVVFVGCTLLPAQEVHLGNVHIGNQRFGVAGEAPPPPFTDSIGAEWNEDEIIAGGYGYSDTISVEMVSNNHVTSYVVGTGGTPADSLAAFVSASNSGDTIVVNDALELDWSARSSLNIPAGVIISGQRGTINSDTASWGALLYCDSIFGYDDAHTHAVIVMWYDKARVTGLRLRGSYSPLEGNSFTEDTVDYNMEKEYGVRVLDADSCEIDNCEIWGFGHTTIGIEEMCRGTNVHNNHLHHQGLTWYHGYGMKSFCNTDDTLTLTLERNLFDYSTSPYSGGGNYAQWNKITIRYNIVARTRTVGINIHGTGDSYMPVLTAYNNTFYETSFAETGNNVRILKTETYWNWEDTTRVYLNWCYPKDSASCFKVSQDKLKIYDNHYTPSYPDGLAGRIPTAVIGSDVDSGTIPLTVKFSSENSSDPDGTIMQYYWDFGDSCDTDNYVRYTNLNEDSVSHTYSEIGKYYVELAVVDDNGCRDYAYKTIIAKPNDSNKYLSFWVNDYESNADAPETGKVFGQAFLETTGHSYLVWEQDIAGFQNWEHVIVDVTDSLDDWACDSVNLTFRIYCKQSGWSNSGCFYFDDIWLFGGNVQNWNLEHGWPALDTVWSGVASRTDGKWVGVRATPGYSWDDDHWIHSGFNALSTWFTYGAPSAGSYARFTQKVDVLGQ